MQTLQQLLNEITKPIGKEQCAMNNSQAIYLRLIVHCTLLIVHGIKNQLSG